MFCNYIFKIFDATVAMICVAWRKAVSWKNPKKCTNACFSLEPVDSAMHLNLKLPSYLLSPSIHLTIRYLIFNVKLKVRFSIQVRVKTQKTEYF